MANRAGFESINYIKIRRSGNWGVIGMGLAEGQIVNVFKRNGGVETEQIGEVVARYRDGRVVAETVRKGRGPAGKGTQDYYFTNPQDE